MSTFHSTIHCLHKHYFTNKNSSIIGQFVRWAVRGKGQLGWLNVRRMNWYYVKDNCVTWLIFCYDTEYKRRR